MEYFILNDIQAIEVTYRLFFYAIIIDFCTGVIVAMKNGRLKSRTCSDGLFRSLGELVVLAIMIVLDNLVPSTHLMIVSLNLGFIFKEGISICENLIKLGVWIPPFIYKMLEEGVEKVEKGGK